MSPEVQCVAVSYLHPLVC